MPPRSKARIRNEPKKEETLPVVQQIKSAMTPNVPIEQVVYLNDDKVVYHDSGSNRYWINYPETWRTISNQQLVLGVRAIRKFWNNVYAKIVVVYRAKNEDKSWMFVFEDSFKPEDMKSGKEQLLTKRINDQWHTWLNQLPEDDKTTYFKVLQHYDWITKYQPFTFWVDIHCPIYTDDESDYNVYIDQSVSGIYGDMPTYFTLTWDTSTYSEHMRLRARPFAYKEINDTYLLAASFVGQTNYQYLGFTNTEFNPPKKYVLPIGDTRYWIDVVSSDGRNEIELDARDLVVVELSLTAIPIQKYV